MLILVKLFTMVLFNNIEVATYFGIFESIDLYL